MKRLFADICKTEDQDDGTIKVYGWASTDSVDSDGETVTADAMRAALPDYMRFGAVREMHDAKKAAGTAIEAEVRDDGRTWFGAHVVDGEAVKKVKAGVYKGFSIGGRATERDQMNKSIIKGLKLVEVSLVDRPANPDTVFTMFKAEGATMAGDMQKSAVDELAEMFNSGEAKPAEVLALVKVFRPAEEVKKYAGEEISDAQTALSALAEINWLLTKESGEVEQVPEQLAALRQVIVSLKAFITSELAEESRVGGVPVEGMGGEVEMSDAGGDVAKAGKKFSAATREALAKCHQAMKAASDHLDALGYDADETADKAADVEDIAKAATSDDLAEFVKAAGAASGLDLLKSMAAEIERLKAEPAPAKGARMGVVSKSADMGGEDAGNAESTDPLALIKAAQSRPFRIS